MRSTSFVLALVGFSSAAMAIGEAYPIKLAKKGGLCGPDRHINLCYKCPPNTMCITEYDLSVVYEDYPECGEGPRKRGTCMTKDEYEENKY